MLQAIPRLEIRPSYDSAEFHRSARGRDQTYSPDFCPPVKKAAVHAAIQQFVLSGLFMVGQNSEGPTHRPLWVKWFVSRLSLS